MKNNRNEILKLRVTKADKEYIEKKAYEKGFKNVSEFMRFALICACESDYAEHRRECGTNE